MDRKLDMILVAGATAAMSMGGLDNFMAPSPVVMRRNRITEEELARQKAASIKAEEKRLRRQERNRRLQEKRQ